MSISSLSKCNGSGRRLTTHVLLVVWFSLMFDFVVGCLVLMRTCVHACLASRTELMFELCSFPCSCYFQPSLFFPLARIPSFLWLQWATHQVGWLYSRYKAASATLVHYTSKHTHKHTHRETGYTVYIHIYTHRHLHSQIVYATAKRQTNILHAHSLWAFGTRR